MKNKAAQELRAIPSETRSEASRSNGRKQGDAVLRENLRAAFLVHPPTLRPSVTTLRRWTMEGLIHKPQGCYELTAKGFRAAK